jgi:hypothetical protein
MRSLKRDERSKMSDVLTCECGMWEREEYGDRCPSCPPVQKWLVISLVSDMSWGPFDEDEAKRFAAVVPNRMAITLANLQRDPYSKLRYAV